MGTKTPTNRGKRLLWTKSGRELFIDLMVEEAEKGYRPDGNNYPKGTWDTICKKINETMGTNYTNVHVRNIRDTLRKSWKAWCLLVAAPDMKWDPVTRTFGATKGDWERYLKENPKAAPFKKKVIPFEEKIAFIFKGVIEPGLPCKRPKRKTVENHSKSLQIHNEPLTGNQDDADNNDEPNPLRRRLNGVGFGESWSTDIPICTPAEAKKILDASLVHLMAPYKYSIGECIECLDELEEVDRGGKLYLFALDLFLEKENREHFMRLKDPTLRVFWLLGLRAAGSATVAAVLEP